MTHALNPRATRQAWLVWSVAVAVYLAAVFHRASLGVAGLEAGERFGVGPAALGVVSLGGPASSVSFALARDYNPLPRIGTATGVVNVGGFTAVTISALAVGVVLDLAGSFPVQQAYRLALLTVLAMLLLGFWRTLVWWRRARAAVFAAQSRGEPVPVQIRPRRWDADVPSPATIAS